MKTLIISLVSEQTIPNVRIINEFKNNTDNFECFFVSTKKCRHQFENICKTCDIVPNKEKDVIEVEPENAKDIKFKLEQHKNTGFFETFDNIILNLTGGTKIMSLSAHAFFTEYYPDKTEEVYNTQNHKINFLLNTEKDEKNYSRELTLKEYLTCYGLEYKESTLSNIPYDTAKKLFHLFTDFDNIDQYKDIISYFRNNRGKNKIKIEDDIKPFFEKIEYKPDEYLSKEEIKYFSGDWFEEYIYYSIKDELNLDDEQIKTGVTVKVTLNNSDYAIRLKETLLKLTGKEDPDVNKNYVNNEIDVMFVYKNKLYIVECKTNIFIDGTKKDILNETIYKSDSIKTRFGLFPNRSIITLTSFKHEINNRKDSKSAAMSFNAKIARAVVSDITLIDGCMLKNKYSVSKLLGISK